MQIEWRELAIEDLLGIVVHIAADNQVAAFEVDDEIHRQVELLAAYRNMGVAAVLRAHRSLSLLIFLTLFLIGLLVRQWKLLGFIILRNNGQKI